MKKKYDYIYGPVPSWRLGSSLGIDPISKDKKICSFDCIYCQIGQTKIMMQSRLAFVPSSKVVKELNLLPPVKIDYITFSGSGEPTLAANLGEMISAVRKTRKEKIAVLTNSSLIDREDVQEDLSRADFVVAKLDAPDQLIFKQVNRPVNTIKIDRTIDAILKFKKRFKGRLALQTMFVEQNKDFAPELAKIARRIRPDEVQLNTPLRQCGVKPLSREEMASIERSFNGLKVVSVYRSRKSAIRPVSSEDTLRRRGKILSGSCVAV